MFRRMAAVGLLAIASVSVVETSARAQMPFPRDLVPKRTSLERLGLERQWYAVVPLVEAERLLRISLTGNFVFAQTSYAMVYTYDAETGRLLWSAQLGQRTAFARGAASNSFAVFVSNADEFYCLDRGSGRTIWKYDLGTMPTTSPAADEHQAMVGLTTGEIFGFELKRRDDKGVEHIWGQPRVAWNWATGGPLSTRPLPAQQIVCFGSNDGKTYAVAAYEHTPLFRFPSGGPIGEGLGSYGTRMLLIPSGDNNLYAVDLFTARALWTFASGSPIEQEPLVVDEDIYSVNTAGLFVALDPSTGEPRWQASTHGGRLNAISPTKLYLRSADLDLFVVDRKTGRTLVGPGETHFRIGLNLREYSLNIVNRFNDRLYFGTDSGMIVCMRESGLAQPHLLRDPKAPTFGYVPPEGIKLTPPPPPGAEQPKTEEGAPGAEDAAKEKDKEKAAEDKEKAADEKEKPADEKVKPAEKEKDEPADAKEKEKPAEKDSDTR
jgi:outer membrane protein assembly factor BamB